MANSQCFIEMNESDLICFYITTYHRPFSLCKCLCSVISEIYRIEQNNIIIYVSNDDKNDKETKYVVEMMSSLYPLIVYIENETTLGIDGNMRQAYSINSKVKYCLMLGDDDELAYSALSIILKGIKKYNMNLSFILCAFEQTGVDTKNRKSPKYVLYKNAKRCFDKLWDHTPWGVFISNLELSNKAISEGVSDRFMGTFHFYKGIMWDIAAENGNILYIDYPLIIRREIEKKSYSDAQIDVSFRALPEFYDKLSSYYEPTKSKKKEELLTRLYIESSDENRELLEKMHEEVKKKKQKFKFIRLWRKIRYFPLRKKIRSMFLR